jgi:transcription elongation factor SPT4
VLNLKGDTERVLECTSATFEGSIAMMKPEASWVSRWYFSSNLRQRIDKFQKGVYAVQVTGKLPLDLQDALMDKGIRYRARDGTVLD